MTSLIDDSSIKICRKFCEETIKISGTNNWLLNCKFSDDNKPKYITREQKDELGNQNFPFSSDINILFRPNHRYFKLNTTNNFGIHKKSTTLWIETQTKFISEYKFITWFLHPSKNPAIKPYEQ